MSQNTEQQIDSLKVLTPEESLKLMKSASETFYGMAIQTQCHAFVEFTGLINEYIDACQDFQRQNPADDFRECNVHSGKKINFPHFRLQYLQEKLTCIYQDNILKNIE